MDEEDGGLGDGSHRYRQGIQERHDLDGLRGQIGTSHVERPDMMTHARA